MSFCLMPNILDAVNMIMFLSERPAAILAVEPATNYLLSKIFIAKVLLSFLLQMVHHVLTGNNSASLAKLKLAIQGALKRKQALNPA